MSNGGNEKKTQQDNRDTFSSKLGFILACIGSAVGMGNIWMFPYRTGQFGGAAFLIPYLLFVIILGYTGLIGEFAFGRMTQTGPIGSFEKAMKSKGKKGGALIGIVPVLGAFGIATGYAVVVGWFIRFLFGSLSGAMLGAADPGAYFGEIAGAYGSIGWHFAGIALTAVILILGVANGIEKVNKVMMPIFFVLFLVILVRVITLPGAMEGVKYMLVPKWEFMSQPKTWIYALGQAFFSLSLAGSGMVVYGSYLKRDIDIPSCAKNTAFFDTVAALIAGLVIIPAVFAFGLDPAAGPPLIFITLPMVFRQMPAGELFAILFFTSVLFAAITSLMNLLEVPIEALQNRLNVKRIPAVLAVCTVAFAIGIFIESGDLLGKWMDFLSIYVIPLGALLAGIMFFWVIGVKVARSEVETGASKPLGKWFEPMTKYVFVMLTFIVVIGGILLGGIG
ncbi:sodium-dependent transporter [Romboutsia sp.]|uniref:sodium-dependent transporter n=1 Tax=Romboutsia sp. TaxID=1965302 RepID=UPI002D078F8C|nr:sodium-dependent transporter [Romboutsia sp.]HSQ89717.1 sodium-dependent transporter [Romboutsia sp.]